MGGTGQARIRTARILRAGRRHVHSPTFLNNIVSRGRKVGRGVIKVVAALRPITDLRSGAPSGPPNRNDIKAYHEGRARTAL